MCLLVTDLALTELAGPVDGERTYYVRVGSAAGAEALAQVPSRARSMTPSVLVGGRSSTAQPSGWDGLSTPRTCPGSWPGISNTRSGARWPNAASRAAISTLVCPTCFCSDVKDVTDVNGAVERQRRWASCFDLDHSYLHGGSVLTNDLRADRQWMTHKLSTWWDQFDESGCVGCGRCIAWCPVGIDITEEAAAIRASDGSIVDTIDQMLRES